MYRNNEFEDRNHFYRFLEHEPFIPRCFNFRGSPNDGKPKPASIVSHRLAKIMSAVLESYASEDRRHLDYVGISNSEEFRRCFSQLNALCFLVLQRSFLPSSSYGHCRFPFSSLNLGYRPPWTLVTSHLLVLPLFHLNAASPLQDTFSMDKFYPMLHGVFRHA